MSLLRLFFNLLTISRTCTSLTASNEKDTDVALLDDTIFIGSTLERGKELTKLLATLLKKKLNCLGDKSCSFLNCSLFISIN